MDANALKQRDKLFAARLKQRDRSVLIDIDRAYATRLRALLEQARGRCFGDPDIEEILDVVLMTVWLQYDAKRQASVRTFYFHVGRRRLLDRLKKNGRYRAALQALSATKVIADNHDNELPDVRLLRVERSKIDAQIRTLIAQAVETLTPRQRLAFTRRFATGDSASWAKKLAKDRGMSAKYWRKASDDGRQKVCKFLTENGVQYSEKGGHYEINKNRYSAG